MLASLSNLASATCCAKVSSTWATSSLLPVSLLILPKLQLWLHGLHHPARPMYAAFSAWLPTTAALCRILPQLLHPSVPPLRRVPVSSGLLSARMPSTYSKPTSPRLQYWLSRISSDLSSWIRMPRTWLSVVSSHKSMTLAKNK